MSAFAEISSFSAAPGWYCLRVLAKREHIAARNLEQRAGVPVFSPRIQVRRETRRGLMAVATEALFPGYVFARFSYAYEARRVASTPGVLSLVNFAGTPKPVEDGVISHLDAEVRRACAASAAEPHFEEGTWVRIITGCFRGNEGRVISTGPASSSVCVLLTLLGHEIQISVPGDQLAGSAEVAGHFPSGLRSDGIRPPVR